MSKANYTLSNIHRNSGQNVAGNVKATHSAQVTHKVAPSFAH